MKFTSLLIVLSTISFAQSAPIPKQPKEITAEIFNDTIWDYQYDTRKNGKIQFNKDGTYNSYHYINDCNKYCGIWYVNRLGIICLQEITIDNNGNASKPVKWYMYIKQNNNNTTLTGYMTTHENNQNGCFLKLSNPQHIEKDDE